MMDYTNTKPEMLDEINAIFNKEIDPIFMDLARKIEPRIENPRYMPWLLAHKMSAECAKILMALPDPDWTPELGDHMVSDTFIEKLGMDKEYVRKQLEDRYFSGDIFYDKTTGEPIVTPGGALWADLQNNPDWMKRNGFAYYKAVAMFHEYDFAPCIEETMHDLMKEGIHGLNQICPRYDSVKDCPDLLPVENYKEILRSKKKLTQNQCACRTRYPEYEQDDHVCISADETADFMIAHNLGKEVSFEEMFDYIQKSGKKIPHMHVVAHTLDMKDIGTILCNCNVNTCSGLRHITATGGKYHYREIYNKSRFRAVLDPEKCIDCGLCYKKRCMFDAIHKKFIRDYGDEALFVNESTCMGCGCCVETCPTGALTMKLVDPPEALLGWNVVDGKAIDPKTIHQEEEEKEPDIAFY